MSPLADRVGSDSPNLGSNFAGVAGVGARFHSLWPKLNLFGFPRVRIKLDPNTRITRRV